MYFQQLLKSLVYQDSWLNPQDGVSLVNHLTKNFHSVKNHLFLVVMIECVIDNHWKLVSLPSKNGPKLELYDLSKDPSETANLKKKVPVFTIIAIN